MIILGAYWVNSGFSRDSGWTTPGCSLVRKESACIAGGPGSIPGWERPPGEGNGKIYSKN